MTPPDGVQSVQSRPSHPRSSPAVLGYGYQAEGGAEVDTRASDKILTGLASPHGH